MLEESIYNLFSYQIEQKYIVPILRCPYCKRLVYYEEREDPYTAGKYKFERCPHLAFYYASGTLVFMRKDLYEKYRERFRKDPFEKFEIDKVHELFKGTIYEWEEPRLTHGPAWIYIAMGFTKKGSKAEFIGNIKDFVY